MLDNKIILLIIILLVGGVLLFSLQNPVKKLGTIGDVHKHADLKLYINSITYNFTKVKYMSSENNSLSKFMHFHDLNGKIIHQHISGATLSMFFKSLDMSFDSNCFSLDNGSKYCKDAENDLLFYVNGIQNFEYGNYEFNDLDRILISYGNKNLIDIKSELDSVTNDSCIPSEKCPERGKPESESSCLSDGDCTAGGS